MASHESTPIIPPRVHDLSGQTFKNLTVIAFAGMNLKGTTGSYWRCQCRCGKELILHTTVVKHQAGCGCHVFIHNRATTTHLREYRVFRMMWERCTNPKNKAYKYYGARGITVCQRWKDFRTFVADIGPRPGPGYTLDRIDNDGPYAPDNIRWSTQTDQVRNSRTARLITFHGITLSLSGWAERLNINYGTLKGRLKLGWPLEQALSPKLRQRHSAPVQLSMEFSS